MLSAVGAVLGAHGPGDRQLSFQGEDQALGEAKGRDLLLGAAQGFEVGLGQEADKAAEPVGIGFFAGDGKVLEIASLSE